MSEPVAWRVDYACGHSRFTEEYEEDPIACLMLDGGRFAEIVPLYTAPPEVEALVEALRDVTDELEAEIEHRYQHTIDHPAMKDRCDRDMESVVAARAALPQHEDGR